MPQASLDRALTPRRTTTLLLLLAISAMHLGPGPSRAADRSSVGALPSWYNPLFPIRTPPTKASEEAKTARIVAGRELETTLRGNALRRRGAGITLPDLTENFATNGTWMLTGTRAPADGVYRLDEDRFCVEFPRNKISCRQLLVSNRGNYFTRAPGDKFYAEPVKILIT